MVSLHASHTLFSRLIQRCGRRNAPAAPHAAGADLAAALEVEIAAHQQTRRELAQAQAQALAANQAKAAFVAVMSHELRTPLTSIMGYCELMRRDIEQDEHDQLRHDVDRVLASSSHLLALINDVLDFGKLEVGSVEVSVTDIDTRTVVGSLLDELQPLATRNNNRLSVSIDEAAVHMRSDADKLRQILFNVVHNALKFTSNGCVTVRVSGMGASLCFQVSDTGIGIAPEHQQHIFDAFTIGDSSSTRSYGGVGVGLALSRSLCQLLAGEISVTSAPGKGSTFTVRLPRTFTPAGSAARVVYPQ
jgi:signal transduction histidine kinase